MAKIIANKIFTYGIVKGFNRQEQFEFQNPEKKCISLYTSLSII